MDHIPMYPPFKVASIHQLKGSKGKEGKVTLTRNAFNGSRV